jgi:hypothetical protein
MLFTFSVIFCLLQVKKVLAQTHFQQADAAKPKPTTDNLISDVEMTSTSSDDGVEEADSRGMPEQSATASNQASTQANMFSVILGLLLIIVILYRQLLRLRDDCLAHLKTRQELHQKIKQLEKEIEELK